MSELFESGRVVDLILLLVAVEALALTVWRRAAARPLVVGLLPGVALMLALRAALTDAAWPWVAVALGAGLVLHLVDLQGRLQGDAPGVRTRTGPARRSQTAPPAPPTT